MSTQEDKEQIKSKIRREVNPDMAEGLKHNEGQPKKPPHPTHLNNTAKFLTNCSKEHAASLQCIEQNYQNRSACQEFFDNYRACRKEENDRRKEANAKASGGSGGWFW